MTLQTTKKMMRRVIRDEVIFTVFLRENSRRADEATKTKDSLSPRLVSYVVNHVSAFGV